MLGEIKREMVVVLRVFSPSNVRSLIRRFEGTYWFYLQCENLVQVGTGVIGGMGVRKFV
jgi:hypothetical protein